MSGNTPAVLRIWTFFCYPEFLRRAQADLRAARGSWTGPKVGVACSLGLLERPPGRSESINAGLYMMQSISCRSGKCPPLFGTKADSLKPLLR